MKAEEIAITEAMKVLTVRRAMLDGSIFNDIRMLDAKITNANLNGLCFNDIQMMNAKITNANLSDLEIEGAQLGGAFIHNIGKPPKGHPMYKEGDEQRPLRFEDCDLHGSTITNCNLKGVVIDECNITGMKINGVLVEDMLREYQKKGG